MSKESCEVDLTTDCCSKSSKKRAKKSKSKKKKLSMEGVDVMEMKELGSVQVEDSNINSDGGKVKRKKKRKKVTKQCLEENSIKAEAGEYDSKAESSMKEGSSFSSGGSEKNETFEKKHIALEDVEDGRADSIVKEDSGEKILDSNNGTTDQRILKKRAKRSKSKKKKLSREGVDVMEMKELGSVQVEDSNMNSDGGKVKRKKKRKKITKQCLEENSIKAEAGEYDSKAESSMKEGSSFSGGGSEKNEIFGKKHIALEDIEDERADSIVREDSGEKILDSNNGKADQRIIKRKKRLLKEAANADMRGICYLSRVPPHMDPLRLRQILSQYGEIQRIYLAPEDAANQVRRKRAGGFRGQLFSEGYTHTPKWVEFTDKRVAKKVAHMLNGEQIGGRKRSSFYFDLWNIKYLSKFKWDDLTEETAYKHAIREQKLALEISAAKRERDFYLSKVDKSRALNSIEERLKKKQKLQEDSEMNPELAVNQKLPKLIRNFPQTQPVADSAVQNKQRLSKNILAGVFGSS